MLQIPRTSFHSIHLRCFKCVDSSLAAQNLTEKAAFSSIIRERYEKVYISIKFAFSVLHNLSPTNKHNDRHIAWQHTSLTSFMYISVQPTYRCPIIKNGPNFKNNLTTNRNRIPYLLTFGYVHTLKYSFLNGGIRRWLN